MRRLLSMVGLVAALGASHVARADDDDWDDEDQAQQNAQVNQQTFQQQLQPYGQWESDSTYGQVFYPEVAAGWRPYTYGHWAWTEAGWLWVSNEPFGWATFHYGRWWYNPYRQHWGWVPGYEWAPAWVTFRFGGASIGWAPLYVGYDGWVNDYPVYYDHWNFVPCEHFYGGDVYAFVYAPTYVRTVFYSTQVSTGYVGTTSYGPPTTYVAAHSAVPITTTPIAHAASPAAAQVTASGAVAVYQPPTTRVYNPVSPAPAALRGPGAAATPIVAPPTVRGAFNSSTFAAHAPQAQPGFNPAAINPRPGTTNLGNAPRANGPTLSQHGELPRPATPTMQQPSYRPNGDFNRQPAPTMQQPSYRPNGDFNRQPMPGNNGYPRPQQQVTPPPNNYRPSLPAPVQQPRRPQFNAPPHAMEQQPQGLGGMRQASAMNVSPVARPSFNVSASAPSFAPRPSGAPSFNAPKRK